MNPNKKLPNKAPSGTNEATNEASSIVILPVANGELSDVSKLMLGLAQPAVIPNPIGSIFTVCVCVRMYAKCLKINNEMCVT